MKIDKKTFWNLVILFEVILIIKICLSFFMDVPTIYSDEACIILRAKHFINTFEIKPCQEIANMASKSPLPLYSIIISPIYLFTSGLKAYYTILIFNSLLISSLVFPLFSITKNFINKKKTVFLAITLFLFLPELVTYEKTIMTETVFLTTCVWLLYFYINSFSNNKKSKIFKLLTILFGIIASFIRPYGFISLIAIFINELIVSKNKKKLLLILFPICIFISILAGFLYLNESVSYITQRFLSLTDFDNWILIAKALKAQANSFIIVTYFIPLILFLINFKKLGKIKYYLISFIILNFLISAQHIYGYHLNNNDPLLITRYINASTVYIMIFGLIFLFTAKKIKLNIYSTLTITIILGLFFFFKDDSIKHSLNYGLAPFYNAKLHFFDNDLIESKNLLGMPFLIYSFILLILLFLNKRKIIIAILGISLLIHSSALYFLQINYTMVPKVIQAFKDTNYNIAYFIDNKNIEFKEYVWHLLSVTDNKINVVYLTHSSENPDVESEINISEFENEEFYKNSDFIISTHEINLPVIMKEEPLKVYKKW